MQAPDGKAQGGIDRQMVYVPVGNISQVPLGWGNTVMSVNIRDFWIGKTAVTGLLWREVYDWAVTKGYTFANQGRHRGTMFPVTSVSWYDVVFWTNAYSEKDGLVPVYRDTSGNVLKNAGARTVQAIISGMHVGLTNTNNAGARKVLAIISGTYVRLLNNAGARKVLDKAVQSNNNGYRLPMAEEGEIAARWLGTTAPTTGSLAKERIATTGKDGKTYYWTPGNYASGATENSGNHKETQSVAWYGDIDREVREVGRQRANTLGMFDTGGNVSEWLFTGYAWSRRCGYRGGSYYDEYDDSNRMTVSNVRSGAPSNVDTGIGFRLARTAL